MDDEFAAATLALSTIFGIITLPFWLYFLI